MYFSKDKLVLRSLKSNAPHIYHSCNINPGANIIRSNNESISKFEIVEKIVLNRASLESIHL